MLLALTASLVACRNDRTNVTTTDGTSTAGNYVEPAPGTTTTPGMTTTPGTNTMPGGAGMMPDGMSVSDAADRVERALEDDVDLRPFDLDADDEGNVIVLTGSVSTDALRQRAEQIARDTAPGFTIENRVRLR
ncbi:MAG: BON domain-containing protein [Rubricoccaceae bacterium]